MTAFEIAAPASAAESLLVSGVHPCCTEYSVLTFHHAHANALSVTEEFSRLQTHFTNFSQTSPHFVALCLTILKAVLSFYHPAFRFPSHLLPFIAPVWSFWYTPQFTCWETGIRWLRAAQNDVNSLRPVFEFALKASATNSVQSETMEHRPTEQVVATALPKIQDNDLHHLVCEAMVVYGKASLLFHQSTVDHPPWMR
jgi:hypothetical protein